MKGVGVIFVAVGVIVGCARSRPAPPTVAPPHAGVAWRYEVRVPPSLDEIAVDVEIAAGFADELSVERGAERFVRDVEVAGPDGWARAQRAGTSWTPPCRVAGCHLRYRFRLREAAMELHDPEQAIAFGDAIISPPSTFLLRPVGHVAGPSAGARYRVHVEMPPGQAFVSGVLSARDGAPDSYEADVADLPNASFAAFGALRLRRIDLAPARIDVAVTPGAYPLDDDAIARWIHADASALARYYDGFPVNRLLVIVSSTPHRPMAGETLGDGGPAIFLRVPADSDPRSMNDDWVVTHEMLHTAFPALERNHAWLSEGLASYVEPIVRARAGSLTVDKLWKDLNEGLPQGLPEKGDEGLEKTHTWGRTYWGGTLFCLLADLEIRQRTENHRSLDDVLRAILARGGDVMSHWTIERVIAEGDAATGTSVLRDLYARLALAPSPTDLEGLWKKMGVTVQAGQVHFDDGAPLAPFRRAITASRHEK